MAASPPGLLEVSLSPYMHQQTAELSHEMRGTSDYNEEFSETALSPPQPERSDGLVHSTCSQFNLNKYALNPEAVELGWKEPDNFSVPSGLIHRIKM